MYNKSMNQSMIRINISHLGFLNEASLDIGPLTIIAGKNNTGKTYLSYFLFILFKSFSDLHISTRDLNEKGQLEITKEFLISKIQKMMPHIQRQLGRFFASSPDLFKETTCSFELDGANLFKFLQDQSKKGKIEISFVDAKGKIVIWTESKGNKLIWTLAVDGQKAKSLAVLTTRIASASFFDMALQNMLSQWINPIAITSERTGISLFYKELDSTRSALVDLLVDKTLPSNKYQLWEQLDKSISKYALPIKTNISTIRDVGEYKNSSFLWKNKEQYGVLFKLWEQLINGQFDITKDSISFSQDQGRIEVPLHLSSSASKSLFLFEIYLKYQATPTDFLLIDEPELNLHPEAQRIMARFLVQLVQAGIRVLITTHSEIIIREINNLIMLNRILRNGKTVDEKIKCELDYYSGELLDPHYVSAYMTTSRHDLQKAEVNEYGLDMTSFEKFIDHSNAISDKIMEILEDL